MYSISTPGNLNRVIVRSTCAWILMIYLYILGIICNSDNSNSGICGVATELGPKRNYTLNSSISVGIPLKNTKVWSSDLECVVA